MEGRRDDRRPFCFVMRYSILHENTGRLRLKLRYSRLDIETADRLEYALNTIPAVSKASVQ